MKALPLTLAAALLIGLAGCTTRGGVESAPPVEDRGASAGGAQSAQDFEEGVEASGAAAGGTFQGDPLEDPANPLSERIVYFEFDSNEITPQFQQLLHAHSQYLAAHPEKRLVVEGHTDERGSREYNLALGERRAEAVKRVLVLNGATAEQVEGVSFGEEQPAQTGSDEAAMSQNRRAELNYQR